MGIGPQIADSGMDMQLALRRDSHQAIEAIAAGGVIGLPDADADDLVTYALSAQPALLLPAKLFRTLCQCLGQVCTGERALAAAVVVVTLRGVDAADRQAIYA